MGTGDGGDGVRQQRMAVLRAAFSDRRNGSGLRARRAVLPDAVVSAELSRAYYVDAVSGVRVFRVGRRAGGGSRDRPYERRAGHAGLALAVSARRPAVRRAGVHGVEAAEGSYRRSGLAVAEREVFSDGADCAAKPSSRDRAFLVGRDQDAGIPDSGPRVLSDPGGFVWLEFLGAASDSRGGNPQSDCDRLADGGAVCVRRDLYGGGGGLFRRERGAGDAYVCVCFC